MKLYIQTTPNGSLETIDVKEDPLGKGGQGAVYNIITPQYRDEYCIKIYLKDAQKAYEKIKYMVTHPPQNIKDNPSFRICWPTALVYNTSKQFVGYMMPLAFPKGHDLTILSVYQRRPLAKLKKFKDDKEWHNKYELDTKEGIINRIKMLCNVAIALHKIHDTGRYVLVDLKPENIDATGTGKVSIMDTDSIQISEGGRILHPATAFTPDYFAPEGKELQRCKRPFSVQCDCFAAAVCFYQILTGVHPYGGTVLRHPYDKCESFEECIAQGLFAHGEKSSYISFPQGFNLQQNFFNLPVEVQRLFKRAFGSKPAERPSMEEWGRIFYPIITKGVDVKSSSVKRSSAPTIPFKVTSIRFSDQAHDGSVIRAAGNKLYTDVSYLCPIVTYDVLSIAGNVDVRYKILAPDGNEVTHNTTGRLPLTTKGTYTRELGGWGNDKKTAYKIPGEYIIELYYSNKCIFKDTFTIHSLTARSTPKVAAPRTTPTTSPSTSSSAPVRITKVTFLDTDSKGSTIHDEGSKLYTDTTFLSPKIYFDVLSPCSSSDLFIKITAPNGSVMTSNMSSAMTGCYRTGIDATKTGSYYRVCVGYGGNDQKAYSLAGKYRFDFYYQNSCIYTESVEIHKKGFFASPSPAASTRRSSSSGGGLNNFVSKIGDWFEDHVDSFADEGTWMIIFAVIGGLGVIGAAISTGSWFWGIAVCVIGYVIGIYVVGIGGVVFSWIAGIFAQIARYIFYNLYTLLATIAVVVGVSSYPAIVEFFDGSKGFTPKSVNTTTQQTTTYICTSHDVLNIRKEPNAKAEVLGTIIPNQAIEVYTISNGWAKVNFSGEIAYASAKYLEPLKY